MAGGVDARVEREGPQGEALGALRELAESVAEQIHPPPAKIRPSGQVMPPGPEARTRVWGTVEPVEPVAEVYGGRTAGAGPKLNVEAYQVTAAQASVSAALQLWRSTRP